MAKYKKEAESVNDRIEDFFLNPSSEIYDKINCSTKLKNQLGDLYDIWSMSVICKYGTSWGIATSGFQDKYDIELKRIYLLADVKPSENILYKLWYIFFATGELKPLEFAYKIAGNPGSSSRLRDTALDLYQKYRGSFSTTEAFVKLDEQIEKKREQLSQLEADSSILDEVKDFKFTESKTTEPSSMKPEPGPEMTPEKAVKMKEAADVFDRVSKSIFNQHRLSKTKK